jgi:transcriptional regulator
MYLPAAFRVSDHGAVLDLIESVPFATLITGGGELSVSHLPLTLTRSVEGWGSLRGHMARANPHWRYFDGARETLVIFHGPHAYVSPTRYANRAAPPTWNYAVVHAYGRPACITDRSETSALLNDLVARYESQPLDLSDAMRRSLEKGIVGFEFVIERVEAKFKLGQNRSPADRAGTIAHLEGGSELERDLAAWTRRMTDA